MIGPRLTVGFTMIELLVVMTIMAILTAITFPVLVGSRENGRRAVCVMNLKQIGQALLMYREDHGGRYPVAKSAVDVNTNRDPALRSMPFVHEAMASYIGDGRVWHCPSDTGWENQGLVIAPSQWALYQHSYMTRPQVFLVGLHVGAHRQPARVWIVRDTAGTWHRGRVGYYHEYIYNSLFADSHVKACTRQEMADYWNVPVQ